MTRVQQNENFDSVSGSNNSNSKAKRALTSHKYLPLNSPIQKIEIQEKKMLQFQQQSSHSINQLGIQGSNSIMQCETQIIPSKSRISQILNYHKKTPRVNPHQRNQTNFNSANETSYLQQIDLKLAELINYGICQEISYQRLQYQYYTNNKELKLQDIPLNGCSTLTLIELIQNVCSGQFRFPSVCKVQPRYEYGRYQQYGLKLASNTNLQKPITEHKSCTNKCRRASPHCRKNRDRPVQLPIIDEQQCWYVSSPSPFNK
eukprot:403335910